MSRPNYVANVGLTDGKLKEHWVCSLGTGLGLLKACKSNDPLQLSVPLPSLLYADKTVFILPFKLVN